MKTRTRFAPSPTGHVHIGNIRVAIYNWLYARHTEGQFLLRIEDTDRERSTSEAVATLLGVLEWMGLRTDEAPLYQSTRREDHLALAEQLLAKDRAYKSDKGETGQGEAILLRMPAYDITFDDEVKGSLRKKAGDMADFVIVRSNGTPVFHLANVADDIHMRITHVIRGDDHVENTYRHIALYRALDAGVPRFAHLPMIVNTQGRPYSKRDGDAYVGDFRDKGYLADALFNYLVLLGWSPGDDREVMPRAEIADLFDFSRVQSSAAQMDLTKLQWMNGVYMRKRPPEEYERECRLVLEKRELWSDDCNPAYLQRVLEVMEERIKLYTDIADQAGFFFNEEYPYDEKAVKKRLLKKGALEKVRIVKEELEKITPFNAETTESAIRSLDERMDVGMGSLIHPIRVATSGLAIGPGLFDMLDVLGQKRVIRRMERTLERFG